MARQQLRISRQLHHPLNRLDQIVIRGIGQIRPAHCAADDQIAADQDFSVRLHGDRLDLAVWTGTRIEGGIEAAIGVQAGDKMANDAIDGTEFSADDNQ